MHTQSLRCVQLFVAPWPTACQTPLNMRFSRQECWSGLPYPTLRDLPDPGIEPTFPASPALAGLFFTAASPGKSKTKKLWNVLLENWIFLLSINIFLVGKILSNPSYFRPWHKLLFQEKLSCFSQNPSYDNSSSHFILKIAFLCRIL